MVGVSVQLMFVFISFIQYLKEESNINKSMGCEYAEWTTPIHPTW